MPFYPRRYVPGKKRRFKRRRFYKKRKGMTASRVKRIAQSVALKGREVKRAYKKINEFSLSPQTATAKVQLVDMDTGDTGDNLTALSNALNTPMIQRLNNEVQPLALNIKGLMKINGTSNISANRETLVRLVVVENNHFEPITPDNAKVFLVGNETSAPAGDINDIFAPFNWKYARPIYDKTFSLCPATFVQNYETDTYSEQIRGTKDWALFSIKHYFGKNAKPMTVTANADTSDPYWNEKNYSIFVYCRNMNDDTQVTSNTIEISATSIFSYRDD